MGTSANDSKNLCDVSEYCLAVGSLEVPDEILNPSLRQELLSGSFRISHDIAQRHENALVVTQARLAQSGQQEPYAVVVDYELAVHSRARCEIAYHPKSLFLDFKMASLLC